MRSHQWDPICVGDWVYHYQGKIKPIGHKFVPKWKGPYVVREVNLNGNVSLGEPLPAIDEEESESEKEREEEEAEVEAWGTEVHWEESSDEDTGEMEVKMKLRDTYGKPEKEFDWHWIMRTPLHKFAQHQVNINQEITEYVIRGFNVEQRMLCFEGRETLVTEAKIRKAFNIPQVGGEVDPTREIPTDTKWLEPYLRTKDLGSTTRFSYGKKVLAPGFRRQIVTLAHALDYQDGLQGVRLEVMWIFHQFHNEYPIDWASILLKQMVNAVQRAQEAREIRGRIPIQSHVHHQRKCNQDDGNRKFFSPTAQGEEGKRRTISGGRAVLLADDDGDGSKQGNHLALRCSRFPNKVYEMEEPPSKIYNEYKLYLKEGTTWEEHLARRAKTRGLQLSEFCAKVVAVLRPLSVIMGCRNNPKSIPVNVLWAFIPVDWNRKLMMKNNGGDTILYPFLAHMSTFLDLRVGDYYKFRPYGMLTDIPDHRTTMAFLKRVETEEDGLFRLLKPGEPTDRVVMGIEEEETDAGEEDGQAAGLGWGGLYIDTSSKEGVQLYFDEMARTHPVPRPDTPPPAVRPIPCQIIQIIMTRKQQQALNGNPSTPTPRTVLMDWDCPRQQVNQERQLPISTQAVRRARAGKAPAEPRAKKAGGRGAAAVQQQCDCPLHPEELTSSSAPPFEIPVVRATEVMDTEQEHHQEGREEEVPADPWGGFTQEPELEPAQYKDMAQILLTLAHKEEISQKLEGRLRTMEEKVPQFEGHLIGVQKFIEEHHEQLLTAITNLSERLPTTTDLPEDKREELRQLRETNARYEQFFSNMPRPPVRTKGH
ncbi:hypothetical protein SELMODRAFT_410546 [Selaginella moellendorffii]|uniref:Uncharacterized protein n=1 Tax=Selaginella moellendorffii TaxID=88036 RepID=D8RF36_SELML|nr:hypothetical protein SELMODRAFT_410546 [Selaginella moellendorffii]